MWRPQRREFSGKTLKVMNYMREHKIAYPSEIKSHFGFDPTNILWSLKRRGYLWVSGRGQKKYFYIPKKKKEVSVAIPDDYSIARFIEPKYRGYRW